MRLGYVTRLAALLLIGLGAATPALAQATAGERQSLLQIFWLGIEVPTYFILAGSIVVMALIVEHFLNVRQATISPQEQVKQARIQIENRNFRECLESLRRSQTFFAQTMTAALSHARHGFDAMHEAALEKSGELSGRMFRKAEYLNILGNLGPLLGLLGTVWGMIVAFGDLAAAGGAAGAGGGAGGLAEGISQALVNTLAGLALAILGIGSFGVCRNRIDSLTVAATVETLDLLEYFRPAPATPRTTERPVTRTPPPRRPAPPAPTADQPAPQ